MTTDDNGHRITETELRLIRLIDRFDVMQRHCDEMSERMRTQMAWKHEIALLERDLRDMKETLDEQASSLTWAVRLLIGTMVTSLAGVIWWLVQKV